MKTYVSIKAEIAKLEQQADALRRGEVAAVIGRIKEAIAAYGLTAADLGFGSNVSLKTKGKRAATVVSPKTVGAARYRDPASGQTWTGRGRPPAWIAAAKNRDEFLIDSSASAKKSGNGHAKGPRKAKAVAKRSKPSKLTRGRRVATTSGAVSPASAEAVVGVQ